MKSILPPRHRSRRLSAGPPEPCSAGRSPKRRAPSGWGCRRSRNSKTPALASERLQRRRFGPHSPATACHSRARPGDPASNSTSRSSVRRPTRDARRRAAARVAAVAPERSAPNAARTHHPQTLHKSDCAGLTVPGAMCAFGTKSVGRASDSTYPCQPFRSLLCICSEPNSVLRL